MIDVLYDHQDFLVINKPSGISVQDEAEQSGILPLLCAQLGLPKLWLIHRLDKVTSGLLILGKNEQAASEFGKLFESKKIAKFYLAIANKKPKKKQGTVSGGMKKVRDGVWILDTTTTNRATTQFFSYPIKPNLRLFLLKPLSGKTHQIRVMMKSLGSPIQGDTLYKGIAADRVYLHAYALGFTYQLQRIELTCKPNTGEDFTDKQTNELINNLPPVSSLPWPNFKIPN